jgi:hypothetical protein
MPFIYCWQCQQCHRRYISKRENILVPTCVQDFTQYFRVEYVTIMINSYTNPTQIFYSWWITQLLQLGERFHWIKISLFRFWIYSYLYSKYNFRIWFIWSWSNGVDLFTAATVDSLTVWNRNLACKLTVL